MRPQFNKWRGSDTAKVPREREQAAMQHTDKLLEMLEQRLASHAAESLPEWCAAHLGGADRTTKASALLRIMRASYGREVLAACREALPQ